MESGESYVPGDLDFGSNYFDGSLYDSIGKGKEPLQFTLNDVDKIDLNPLIDDPSNDDHSIDDPSIDDPSIDDPLIIQHHKEKVSKTPIIPKNVLSKSKSSKSPVVSSSLFRDCMSIQNNNNEFFNDEIDALKRKVDELFKIKQSLQKRVYVLETIVVDQSKDIKHFKEKIKQFKDKFKTNDHYLKDTFEIINKNNYIIGKLIQGNTDMIHAVFKCKSTEVRKDKEALELEESAKTKKRKYKEIENVRLEKQRLEKELKENELIKKKKLCAKITKELEKEPEQEDGVRVSKRLKVRKLVEKQTDGKKI